MSKQNKIDPKLDLVLERDMDIPPELVWKAWTTPKHLMEWFCPKPWKTTECEMDVRPGGLFRSVMQSPEGQNYPNSGCFLEIIEGKKMVWTDALQAGYRPARRNLAPEAMGPFTATVMMEPNGKGGTKYTAIATHSSEEDRKKHEAMGFHEGWGMVADQLVAYMKKQ